MSSVYVPKQCGIKFEPPTLVLVYEDTISEKLRRRCMPIRNLSSDASLCSEAAQELRTRHKRYLDAVPQVLVEKMLRLLQEHMNGNDLQEGLKRVKTEFEVGADEDLNTLPEDVLLRKKAVMELAFSKSRLRPGDPNFEYDKRVEFPQPSSKSEWDQEELLATNVDDDDEQFWD